MITTPVNSVLQLCAPPDGYSFVAGLWLAHDVDMTMVADTIAPVLAGVSEVDPDRRRRLAGETLNRTAQLYVLGCASRLGSVTAFPWVTFVPVGGRVQHAKCGVLQFAKSNSPKRITRSFVASANLTRASLDNREALAWEEAGSQKTTPTLAMDLIGAIRSLTPDLTRRDRKRVRATLRVLSNGLPSSRVSGCIVHSLDNKRPLLGTVAGKRPVKADRLVIVSPPFAGDADKEAARHLMPWIGKGTQIDIYTEVRAEPGAALGPNRRPAFSRSILADLAKASGSAPNVWGVPSYDQDGRWRRLHAKVIAVVTDNKTTVILGSANCTGRGLGGKNRELAVVRSDWTAATLNGWLAGLDPITFDGEVASPDQAVSPLELPNALVEVEASFAPATRQRVRQGRWRGLLRLDLPDAAPGLRIEYRGTPVALVAEQDFELVEREAWLTAKVGRSSRSVPIEIDASDEFWAVPGEREDEEDTILLALLRAIRPPAAGTTSRGQRPGGGTPQKPPGPDDRYTIEPERALALVARRRRQLAMRLEGGLGPAGAKLFTDQIESRVADAVLGHVSEGASTLIAALARSAEDLGPLDE